MSLVLSRVDYVSVSVTSRGTTKILPSNDPKTTQKFAVGDHDGVLHIFSMKKNELQLVFRSLPGYKIEKMVLGGSSNDLLKDKIFVAYNNSVKGFTKKGKMFLQFDTNLMDSITAMYVSGADLAACARDIYHRYQNCKDMDSFLVGEILNDVILLPSDSGGLVFAILACEDRAIRILTNIKSSPIVIRLPSVPTVFSVFRENGRELNDRVLVGTQDGKIGILIIQSTKTIRNTWLIGTNGSEITCLDTYELDNSAAVDIIVGRQDGTIEVFNFSGTDENAGESISSVNGGIIGTPGHTEVLVTTYSGKIFGLTTKSPGALEAGVASNETETLNRLQAEILELELKLNENKEYESYTSVTDTTLSPLILSVNYRMTLNRDTATYLLSIELDSAIDNILIQSDAPIELLDESNNAVLSLSTTNPAVDGNYVLATYRCQVNTSQLETKIKTIEGQSGTLQVYVTSQIQPKCCRRIKIPILALSLHTRIHDDDENNDNLFSTSGSCNELKLTGDFTVAEMHAWLSLALPEISERPNLKDNDVKLNYVSAFIGSTLSCLYRKGSAVFSSENISTILILRDLMTKEATKRKIKLDVFCNIEDGSITKMLELILPQLNAAYELEEKFKIVNALRSWEMTNNPTENLCTYYQELLKDEENIKRKYLKNTNFLQEISGVIIDLYVDWKRAKGYQRLTNEMAKEQLDNAIKSRELSLLLQVFIKKDDNESTSSLSNRLSPSPPPLDLNSTTQDQ